MTTERIDSFSGEYRFLSNFWPIFIMLPERWILDPLGMNIFRSTEHAYQALKTLDRDERLWVQESATPEEAKKRGRQVTLRPDWDGIKLDVMWDLTAAKYSNVELRQKLLDTGNAELIEGNHWGDVYWGVCRGKGENWLGRILMDMRHLIRNDLPPQA